MEARFAFLRVQVILSADTLDMQWPAGTLSRIKESAGVLETRLDRIDFTQTNTTARGEAWYTSLWVPLPGTQSAFAAHFEGELNLQDGAFTFRN